MAGFVRATIKGWQDNKVDPIAFLPIQQKLGKDLGLSEQSQTFQNQSQIPLMESDTTTKHGLFWMDEAGIAANVDAMNSVGIDVTADFFTTEILDAVYKGKNRID